MGRHKGSKNKPKVTTAIIGEVINKPVKKVYLPEGDRKSSPVSPKDPRVAHLIVPTENGDKMVEEGAPAPVLSDEDINAATLKDAQQVVTRRRKLSVKDKSFQDQLDFVFEDLKSLRNYIRRLEDALNVRRNETTNEPEPIVKKRRGKSLTKQEDTDTLPEKE